mmetsp:Transcript_7414/g.8554  ORF Transcript_7414/g.8554 Transcript_7414/m.8554 type:complete len:706 (+) Transcript_7414:75-2192(+)|eukprot:CAMPEP_0197856234 /NCGR_PEP_ID=MMETSP1438-20131217/28145_1 /TAXON_ID=1461541 /ORGANISM="Pterosperma sp., Strain CCMP1384" /LENGTH=705 /DNA_ID=CAMNT_0043471623 /DNA_START=63 /DNA_END=2180 /DNA_ORIENTATION=-
MASDDDISDLSDEDYDISGVDQADVDAWVSEDEGFLAPPAVPSGTTEGATETDTAEVPKKLETEPEVKVNDEKAVADEDEDEEELEHVSKEPSDTSAASDSSVVVVTEPESLESSITELQSKEEEKEEQDEYEELQSEVAEAESTEEPLCESSEARTPEVPAQTRVSDPHEDKSVTPDVEVDLRSQEPTPPGTPAVEDKEIEEMFDDMEENETEPADNAGAGWGGGWGFGGWAKSAISNVTQKVNAASDELGLKEMAKNTMSSVGTLVAPEAESSKTVSQADSAEEDEGQEGEGEGQSRPGKEAAIEDVDKREKLLSKLEGDDGLERSLKALDDKVEKFATNAWSAFGTAWSGMGSLAKTAAKEIKQGIDEVKDTNVLKETSSVTAKLATKGTSVLENLGNATIDFLNVSGDNRAAQSYMDQLPPEEATFDRCFHIYGGPEHLEELEALGEEETLRCNRWRAKQAKEEKEEFDNVLSSAQDTLNLDIDADGDEDEPQVENPDDVPEEKQGKQDKQKKKNPVAQLLSMRDESVSNASELVTLMKQSLIEDRKQEVPEDQIVDLGSQQLKTIKAEGIQRISEMSTTCMLQLLHIGASISDRHLPGTETINWEPEASSKATWVRQRARVMVAAIETVSEAYTSALTEPLEGVVEEGPSFAEVSAHLTSTSEQLRKDLYSDTGEATSKIQDGVQHLLYVIMATTIEKAE